MAKVARKGIDVAGAMIVSGRTTVIVNDNPIVTEGDTVTGGPVIVGYWPSVIAEDRPVARKSDPASNGVVIATGSNNVFAGTDGNE